jgi:outer membrane protein assembly factor BamB
MSALHKLSVLGLLLGCLAVQVRAHAAESRSTPAASALDALGIASGLIVHVQCGDGRMAETYLAGDRFVVHGIDTDPALVARGRTRLQRKGHYGRLSLETWDGERLPYADSQVHLLILSPGTHLDMDECVRVLAPGGVLLHLAPSSGLRYTKPATRTADAPPGTCPACGTADATDVPDAHLFETGPAWMRVGIVESPSDGWVQVRGDARRGSSTDASPPLNPRLYWNTPVGDQISSPVASGDLVLVADTDAHRVVALDAAMGDLRWSFTADGRVEHAPALYRDMVFFVATDGWLYALRVSDGALAWRWHPGPEQRRLLVDNRLASAWIACGGVTLAQNRVYVAIDCRVCSKESMQVFALDATFGKLESSTAVTLARSLDPPTQEAASVMGSLSIRDPETAVAFEFLPHSRLFACNDVNDWEITQHTDQTATLRMATVAASIATWSKPIPSQVRALAHARDALLVAGALVDESAAGSLWIFDAASGNLRTQLPLDAAPVWNGLAIVPERIFAALDDGSVVCIGSAE